MKKNNLTAGLLAFLTAILLVSGCSGGPDIEKAQIRRQLKLTGSFLTESPDEINFPTKVLFAIDCSLSMGDEINGQQGGVANETRQSTNPT